MFNPYFRNILFWNMYKAKLLFIQFAAQNHSVKNQYVSGVSMKQS